jgi:hypothetical protein
VQRSFFLPFGLFGGRYPFIDFLTLKDLTDILEYQRVQGAVQVVTAPLQIEKLFDFSERGDKHDEDNRIEFICYCNEKRGC